MKRLYLPLGLSTLIILFVGSRGVHEIIKHQEELIINDKVEDKVASILIDTDTLKTLGLTLLHKEPLTRQDLEDVFSMRASVIDTMILERFHDSVRTEIRTVHDTVTVRIVRVDTVFYQVPVRIPEEKPDWTKDRRRP